MANANTSTIDALICKKKIPSQKTIIIDEFGLLKKTHWDYILKLFYTFKKEIILYGDNTQLPSPFQEEGLITNEFLEYFSSTYNTEWVNYRNNFKREYYDRLKDPKNYRNIEYVNKQLDKYTKPINEAEYFITYRNNTKQELNKEILKMKNLKFDEETKDISVGLKLTNKTNYLMVGDQELYNQQRFIVDKVNKDDVILKDDNNKEFTITKDIIFENFELGYTMTLYQAQGESFTSFYYDRKDIYFLMSVDNALYTLISRLKTK
jgi:hypothetical protein